MLLIISQLFMLGCLNFVQGEAVFVFTSLLAQIMGGFGAGSNTTVVFSLITSQFQKEKQKFIGFVEAGVGIGLLVGPILGAALYSAGGFSCPFWTLGFAFLIMIWPVFRLTDLVKQCRLENLEASATELLHTPLMLKQMEDRELTGSLCTEATLASSPRTVQPTFKTLWRVPMFSFGLLAQILLFISMSFIQPVLAIHLSSYNLKAVWIGFFFAIGAIAYVIGSLMTFLYQSLMGRRGVIFFAFILLVMATFMVGTSPMLNLKDSPVCIFFGLFLAGFAASAITIPILPEMQD